MKLVVAMALVCAGCKSRATTEHVSAGPAVAWRAALPVDTFDALAGPGGTLVTIGPAGVTALRDGKVAWTRALDAKPLDWLLALRDDAVLTGDDKGTVYAIAIADGAVRWQATTPKVENGGPEAPWIKSAAASGGGALLLDAYMRFLVLDPAACARGADGCMRLSGQLPAGVAGEGLVVAADGTRIVWDFKWIVLYTATGERIASFLADDLVGEPVATSKGIVVAHDQGVARIEPSRCKVEGGRFRLGARADVDEPPAGCLERVHVGPTELMQPVASERALAWVTDTDELRGRGVTTWHIDIKAVHSASQLVADGNTLFVACWVEPSGDDMFVTTTDLCAVTLDSGKLLWRTPLGLPRAKMMDNPWLVVGGGLIHVVLRDDVAAVPMPAR